MNIDNEKSDIDVQNLEDQHDKIDDNEINASQVDKDILPERENKINKRKIYRKLQFLLAVAFLVFSALFINETLIQPYRSKKAMSKIQDLYLQQPTLLPSPIPEFSSPTPFINSDGDNTYTDTIKTSEDSDMDVLDNNQQEQNSAKSTILTVEATEDAMGRLQEFQELLKINEDVKGWLSIEDTYINYPVLQSDETDPEYYLSRNIFKEYDKAGSIFLDIKSSVEDNSKHLVLHGHNMHTTDSMFHALMEYKELNFYKQHPIFNFDSIYQKNQWKIFSIFVTNGTSLWEPLFDYTRTKFENDSDFMNFVYQLRLRSLYNIDSVDVNEDDQLLTLSTCSYELNNYRTVIVARRVREGEDLSVNVDDVSLNPDPLYPKSWYDYYGGKAPSFTTFEEALENGEINWYGKVQE